MKAESPLTFEDLISGFNDLELKKGDSLIVHSSLRILGPVEGGAETIINALLEVIGTKGNLMFPTFNYTRPLPVPYFDPLATPAKTGILAELGRKRPGSLRSLHPTHSVAVIGPDAELITKDHLSCRACGIGSPIDLLAQMGGKVLLIGVTQTTNTTIHIGEEYAGVQKVSWYEELPYIKILKPDGTIVSHRIDTSPSCGSAFDALEYPLRKNGQIKGAMIGNAKCKIMKGSDVINRVVEMIREQPDILLCSWKSCVPCTGARRILKERK